MRPRRVLVPSIVSIALEASFVDSTDTARAIARSRDEALLHRLDAVLDAVLDAKSLALDALDALKTI